MSPMRLNSTGTSRSKAHLALGSLSIAALLAGCAPDPATTPQPEGPAIIGEPCAPGAGVTVVVDFGELNDLIAIGCAPGDQPDGFAALASAGFTVGSEAGPGSVCTIDGLPATAFPDCWYAGYWGYWKSPNYDTAWDFSMVGAGDGPISAGSIEGFAWTVGMEGGAPRVSVADLATAAPAVAPLG